MNAIYNQNNIDILKIAAKEEHRPAITGILFREDKTVATDAYRLIEVSTPKDTIDDATHELAGTLNAFKPFTANAQHLKTIRAKRDKALPVVGTIGIKTIDDDRVEIATVNKQLQIDVTTAQRITEPYPDYEKIIPKGKPAATVTINAKYLAEIAALLSKIQGKGSQRITLKVYKDEYAPLVLEGTNENQPARALIMPIQN